MNRFTIALLGTAIALPLAVEAVTIWEFDRTSKVQRLEIAQRQALLAVKDINSSSTSHLAILGNSLMLEGVDVQTLTEKIDNKAIPVPYFVQGTYYYDWYFGLKELFAEGMRPRYVLLGLSPNHFVSSHTRGEYSARYLFRAEDLIEVAQRTHMDATTASSFMLAHISKYYSTRQIIRGYILGRLFPSVSELLHNKLGVSRDPAIPEITIKTVATDHLVALNELCRAEGAQFILVVPPSYQGGAETVGQVGKDLRIPVLIPVTGDELDSSSYQSDGFHLSQKGATIFTNRLAAALQNLL